MTTTHTTRRLLTLGATVALIATAPGLVGVASAHNNPSPTPATSNAQVTVSPELIKAIQGARDAFRVSAQTAMDTYRTAKTAIHTAMDADANLTALHAAKDAAKQAFVLAYKAGTSTPALQAAFDSAKAALDTASSAYDAAKAPYRAQEDAARNTLRVSIDAAKAVYVTAVKAAFATYAPTATIPANLLELSGKHHGYGFGHLMVKPGKGHGVGQSMSHHAASLHFMGNHR